MTDVKITKTIDGLFIHYRMSPGVLEYMPDEMHIATSTDNNDMTFVSFATVYYDLPAMPGAWFMNHEEAEHAVEKWAQIVHMMSHYKSVTQYVKDLEPPF